MAASVSRIRLRKRSRSLAISSQWPLRDAWRAKGHVRMTWTWMTGENCTFFCLLLVLFFFPSGRNGDVCSGLFHGTSRLSGWRCCFNFLSGRAGLAALDFLDALFCVFGSLGLRGVGELWRHAWKFRGWYGSAFWPRDLQISSSSSSP